MKDIRFESTRDSCAADPLLTDNDDARQCGNRPFMVVTGPKMVTV